MATTRPKLAVWKFSSCDGCQLSLLGCEDELLAVADSVEIAYFLEASRAEIAGPYDISLVEGSITTPDEAERIRRVRAQSRKLITIGACATTGGIQALKNLRPLDELIHAVYAHPDYIESLATSIPVLDHVRVDFELHGCPINKYQLLEVINATLNGRRPNVPSHLRAPEVLRGPVAGARLQRCPGYHGAHLRDLPDGLYISSAPARRWRRPPA